MDFALTEQQQMFRDSVGAFARKKLADGALEVMKNRLAEIIFERRFSQRPPRARSAEGNSR